MEFFWNTEGKDGKDIRRNGRMRGAGCKETGEKDSEVGKLILRHSPQKKNSQAVLQYERVYIPRTNLSVRGHV